MRRKRIFLVLMFFIISMTALLYGFSPNWFARTFLDVGILVLNFAHILRAVMGLYLGFGLFWLFSAFNDNYRNTAVLTSVIFTPSAPSPSSTGTQTGTLITKMITSPPIILNFAKRLPAMNAESLYN